MKTGPLVTPGADAPPGRSLLMRSAGQRVAAALALVVLLWLAVAWALSGGAGA